MKFDRGTLEKRSKEKGLIFNGDISVFNSAGFKMHIVNYIDLEGELLFEWFEQTNKPHLITWVEFYKMFSYFQPGEYLGLKRLFINEYENHITGRMKEQPLGHLINRILEFHPDVIQHKGRNARIDLREATEEEYLNWMLKHLPEAQDDWLPDNFL